MSNPLSPWFDIMCRVGIPHRFNDHCWCKPTVLCFYSDMNGKAKYQDEFKISIHNEIKPPTDDELHYTFKKAIRIVNDDGTA